MNSISMILKNIRNLIPYFLLIFIYFFFVNLEARNDKHRVRNSERENALDDHKSKITNKTMRIEIPVIPYDK